MASISEKSQTLLRAGFSAIFLVGLVYKMFDTQKVDAI